MFLLVKSSNTAAAVQYANRKGICSSEINNTRRISETEQMLDVGDHLYEVAAKWYADDLSAPFPWGTLLWFTATMKREEGA